MFYDNFDDESKKRRALEKKKNTVYGSIDKNALDLYKNSIDDMIRSASSQRQIEEAVSEIFDSEIEKEVLKTPLRDALVVKIPKGDTEYKVLRQPNTVDYWVTQTDKSKSSTENSKVHIQRTADGVINWIGVGPLTDRNMDREKNLKAVDVFMKRTGDRATIQKMDDEILRALGLENNYSWKSPDNGTFQVLEVKKAFRVPERTEPSVTSFPTAAAVRAGAQLFEGGNQKFQNYGRRYDTLLAALNSFCSKRCDWFCECPIEKLNSEVTMVKEKYEDPYKHTRGKNFFKIT